jgi:hypothetical protein
MVLTVVTTAGVIVMLIMQRKESFRNKEAKGAVK